MRTSDLALMEASRLHLYEKNQELPRPYWFMYPVGYVAFGTSH